MRRFLTMLLCVPLLVEGSENEARKIINQMEELYRGESSSVSMIMEVKTPRGSRSIKMSGQTLGKERAIFRILSPKKERGITSLRRDKEMWNFFPKINKVIKIPPSMMMGSWMGSDFTNDDLVQETKLIDEYDLQLKTEEKSYLVILTPKEDTVSVWGKIEYLVQREPMLPIKQAFYDDDGEKIRELFYREPKEFDGMLMPSVMQMIPLNKPGHSTTVIYENLEFDPSGVSETSFSLRELRKRL